MAHLRVDDTKPDTIKDAISDIGWLHPEASSSSSSSGGVPSFTYKRPGGTDNYKRPGGVDTYIRP